MCLYWYSVRIRLIVMVGLVFLDSQQQISIIIFICTLYYTSINVFIV